MTGEEFLEYIGEARSYSCKGKQRQNLMRERYAAYVQAYRVKAFREAFILAWDWANVSAIRRGLEDRDAGVKMVSVPELLTQEPTA